MRIYHLLGGTNKEGWFSVGRAQLRLSEALPDGRIFWFWEADEQRALRPASQTLLASTRGVRGNPFTAGRPPRRPQHRTGGGSGQGQTTACWCARSAGGREGENGEL